MTDELLIERHEGIALVTLNRPQARNALTFPMYEGLARFCAEANDDDAVETDSSPGAGRTGPHGSARRSRDECAMPKVDAGFEAGDLDG